MEERTDQSRRVQREEVEDVVERWQQHDMTIPLVGGLGYLIGLEFSWIASSRFRRSRPVCLDYLAEAIGLLQTVGMINCGNALFCRWKTLSAAHPERGVHRSMSKMCSLVRLHHAPCPWFTPTPCSQRWYVCNSTRYRGLIWILHPRLLFPPRRRYHRNLPHHHHPPPLL